MKKFIAPTQLLLLVLFFGHIGLTKAQTACTIQGHLLDEAGQPVMYAHVALLASADSSILAGTISDDTGHFEFTYKTPGVYIFSARYMGYVPYQKEVTCASNSVVELGGIALAAKEANLEEVVVVEDRLKAKQEVNKTTYYVNKAMQQTSSTGIDMVRHVPGVQVDLLQNISLNGAQDIVITVDGVERDASFLKQVNANQIDRIEINNAPGVEYGAEVSGVIHVILKENKNTGISGHVYANIPTASDEVFSFPTAGLQYALDKLTLYTSYNGGFSYFNIKTKDKRVFSPGDQALVASKRESLFQENWSHKLHGGADYFHNDHNRFRVYGFVRRFSNEQSGTFRVNHPHNLDGQGVLYQKEDFDLNTSAYGSVFYAHMFDEETALSFDANYYMLNSENRLELRHTESNNEQVSRVRPQARAFKASLDFRFPLGAHWGVKTGLEQRIRNSADPLVPEFHSTTHTAAAYFSANYSAKRLQAKAGLRGAYLHYGQEAPHNNRLVVLPALHMQYHLPQGAGLRFSYKQTIDRPSVFQLNPNQQTVDFYTLQKGNPELVPAISHNANLDYSLAFGGSFLQTGLFYNLKRDVIATLSSLKSGLVLEKEAHNAGRLHQFGLATSGSLKLHKNIAVNPNLKLYYVQTQVGKTARSYQIRNKQAVNFEAALSAMVLFGQGYAVSLSAQHNSRVTQMQGTYNDDALYFVSLEKTFNKHFKASITSALPFRKKFTYQAHKISGMHFTQKTADDIQLSVFPIWFKLHYSFASGKDTRRITRNASFEEKIPQKGF